MKHIREVLLEMGVEISVESEFKFRCIRARRKRTGPGVWQGANVPSGSGGLAAFTMVGSAASNGASDIPGFRSILLLTWL